MWGSPRSKKAWLCLSKQFLHYRAGGKTCYQLCLVCSWLDGLPALPCLADMVYCVHTPAEAATNSAWPPQSVGKTTSFALSCRYGLLHTHSKGAGSSLQGVSVVRLTTNPVSECNNPYHFQPKCSLCFHGELSSQLGWLCFSWVAREDYVPTHQTSLFITHTLPHTMWRRDTNSVLSPQSVSECVGCLRRVCRSVSDVSEECVGVCRKTGYQPHLSGVCVQNPFQNNCFCNRVLNWVLCSYSGLGLFSCLLDSGMAR